MFPVRAEPEVERGFATVRRDQPPVVHARVHPTRAPGLDAPLELLIDQSGRFGDRQFRPHIAGPVFVLGLPAPRLRIEEDGGASTGAKRRSEAGGSVGEWLLRLAGQLRETIPLPRAGRFPRLARAHQAATWRAGQKTSAGRSVASRTRWAMRDKLFSGRCPHRG
jgi:hypothetical protein